MPEKIGQTYLYEEDKLCLIKGGWLNDKLIHAFQILIKAQYPT